LTVPRHVPSPDFATANPMCLSPPISLPAALTSTGVSHVINFELPNVPEDYVHRIGRTAGAGAPESRWPSAVMKSGLSPRHRRTDAMFHSPQRAPGGDVSPAQRPDRPTRNGNLAPKRPAHVETGSPERSDRADATRKAGSDADVRGDATATGSLPAFLHCSSPKTGATVATNHAASPPSCSARRGALNACGRSARHGDRTRGRRDRLPSGYTCGRMVRDRSLRTILFCSRTLLCVTAGNSFVPAADASWRCGTILDGGFISVEGGCSSARN
jgi:superfamily II DNA/RNA helicase